jgi:hypothetical protein
MNKKKLLVLEMQPAGQAAPASLSFPSTKADFDLLKQLGKNRQFSRLVWQID